MNGPLLSVVVIGRNEGARLSRCLDSVRAVPGGGALELIYVDSASTDDSVQRAQAAGATVLALRPARPSAALGRNAGWRHASGEFVLFLDGDTVLHPDFIAHALLAMAEAPVAAVWGHRRELAPAQSIYVRVLDLDWIYAPGDSDFCGGDALFRRAALEASGGFDETLIAGEEPELCLRLRAAGGLIRHIDRPMTLHDLAILNFSGYWRRAFRAGHAYAEVAWRTRQGGAPLWRRESRRNLLHGALLAAAPVVLAAAAYFDPLLAVLVLALAALLVLRSAARCAWKSPSRSTRLLYALHSHLQHLPILCGQLAYHRARRRGLRQALIEYQRSPAP